MIRTNVNASEQKQEEHWGLVWEHPMETEERFLLSSWATYW